jgi:hypothetical protein
MITRKDIINIIHKFYDEYEGLDEDLKEKIELETKLDGYLEWYKMHQATIALQNVVELEILPFVDGKIK